MSSRFRRDGSGGTAPSVVRASGRSAFTVSNDTVLPIVWGARGRAGTRAFLRAAVAAQRVAGTSGYPVDMDENGVLAIALGEPTHILMVGPGDVIVHPQKRGGFFTADTGWKAAAGEPYAYLQGLVHTEILANLFGRTAVVATELDVRSRLQPLAPRARTTP